MKFLCKLNRILNWVCNCFVIHKQINFQFKIFVIKKGYKGKDEGLMSGALYHGGQELTKMNTKVYEMSSWSNTLHVEVFLYK